LEREPLVANRRGIGWLSDTIAGVAEGKTPRWWKISFAISVTMMTVCFLCVSVLMSTGVGVWGLGHPVMWGWAIINFVWWIGIGHAGTLISAILVFAAAEVAHLHQPRGGGDDDFRGDVRGHFPADPYRAHLVWWWLFPIPNSFGIWPQFRSPLMWDVFAVSTYFTVSCCSGTWV
jgi:hypothetical protein